MTCLGFDYGSTNSLIACFSDVPGGGIRIESQMPSSVEGTALRSPKRHLSDPHYDGALIKECIVKLMKKMLESFHPSDEEIQMTVTLPNAFKNAQCKVIMDGAKEGCDACFGEGRCSVSILPEPIAAALYYVYLQPRDKESEGNIIVCDIGGGTTDLAVVHYRVTVQDRACSILFNVICTAGEERLGGNDMDVILMEHFKRVYALSPDKYSKKTLLVAARALKRKLSTVRNNEMVEVALTDPYQSAPASGANGRPVVFRMTRPMFKELLEERGLLPRLTHAAMELRDAYRAKAPQMGLRADLSDALILPIGGSSLIPAFQNVMCDVFGGKICPFPQGADAKAPFNSVAKGAAIYSAWRSGALDSIADIRIEGRTLHRISVMDYDGGLIEVVDKNMPSGVYEPENGLTPIFIEEDDTFQLLDIELYEGEGDHVDDDHYGTKPARLVSFSLDDRVCTHGEDIRIFIRLRIDEGRLSSLVIRVPGGNMDKTDYEKTIDLT